MMFVTYMGSKVVRSEATSSTHLLRHRSLSSRNAKCLTEGVDIPAVDMIAFIDPKRSAIDIAQAVGRAMRKPRDGSKKKCGYVIVPLFVGVDDDDFVDAIKGERFDAVVDVLNALQEHDEDLVAIIREIKQRKGEGKPFNPRRLMEKVEVIGPRIEFDVLSESIGIAIADRIGSNWDERFGLLLKYKKREGHCDVPMLHVEAGFPLGRWVIKQRQLKKQGSLRADRIGRLEAQAFVWNTLEEAWEQGFAALLKFKKREGDCLVPQGHTEGDFHLGVWVHTQRQNRRKGSLSTERIARLDAEGFVWGPFEEAWELGFAAFLKFKKRERHCLVPALHIEDRFRLGRWVSKQRTSKAEGSLNAERIARLNAEGFIWDQLEEAWEQGFAALLKYKKREGNCLVPDGHIEGSYPLGKWVRKQRTNKETGSLSDERIKRLYAEGFI